MGQTAKKVSPLPGITRIDIHIICLKVNNMLYKSKLEVLCEIHREKHT